MKEEHMPTHGLYSTTAISHAAMNALPSGIQNVVSVPRRASKMDGVDVIEVIIEESTKEQQQCNLAM